MSLPKPPFLIGGLANILFLKPPFLIGGLANIFIFKTAHPRGSEGGILSSEVFLAFFKLQTLVDHERENHEKLQE